MNPLRRTLVRALLALPAFTVAPARAGGTVDIQVSTENQRTAILITAAEALDWKVFRLSSPDRLVAEFPGVHAGGLEAALQAQIGAGGTAQLFGVRAAENRPGVARAVFALRPGVEYTASPQEGGAGVLVTFTGGAAKIATAPAYERLVTVAIDAGHGGKDPGAVGAGGTLEKDVTLSVARLLKAELDVVPGLRAVLIRDADVFVPLADRVRRARALNADIFLSIHADAAPNRAATGASVYALSEKGATSAAARWLAKKENDADLIGGAQVNVQDPFLRRTLIDLAQTATINDSLRMGDAVLATLGRAGGLHKRQVEQAGFAVLKAPDIPSILVETAFISNREEERRLADTAHQKTLARAIAEGVSQYAGNLAPARAGKLS